MNGKCLVYIHTTPSGKKYVGLTSMTARQRWKYGDGYRSQLFGRAIKKYGWDNIEHEIIKDNLTLEEAKQLEKELIIFFDTTNPKKGYNQTNGGEGCKYVKYPISEKRLEKLRANWIGESNINAKSVICLETLKVYSTMKEAKEDTGASKITECVKGYPKHRTSGGYHWAYYDNTKDETFYIELLDYKIKDEKETIDNYVKSRKGKKPLHTMKKVICVETNEVFESIRDAGNRYNISFSCICMCCKGKSKTAGGYHWAYY